MAEAKLRVLLVDDDQRHLDLTRRFLTLEGFEVHTHTSALGVSNQVASLSPDLVLLDVNFPALKGDRVLGLARQYAPATTLFILYSAADESTLRGLALASGADGYMPKRVQGSELARRLRELHKRGRKR